VIRTDRKLAELQAVVERLTASLSSVLLVLPAWVR
jgi:hypothetical protein